MKINRQKNHCNFNTLFDIAWKKSSRWLDLFIGIIFERFNTYVVHGPLWIFFLFVCRISADECSEWNGSGVHWYRERGHIPAVCTGGSGQVCQTGQERSVSSSPHPRGPRTIFFCFLAFCCRLLKGFVFIDFPSFL